MSTTNNVTTVMTAALVVAFLGIPDWRNSDLQPAIYYFEMPEVKACPEKGNKGDGTAMQITITTAHASLTNIDMVIRCSCSRID